MEDCNFAQKELIEELSQACDGLMWLSESDYPWQVIYWQDESHLDSQTLLQKYGYKSDVEILETTLDSFFHNAATEQEWHDEVERFETRRYQNLLGLLKNNLIDTKVFLVGKIEIDAYVLGKFNDSIVGLSTKIIET